MPHMPERSDNIFCEICLTHNVTKLGTLIMINYDSLEWRIRNLLRSAEAYYVILYFLLIATMSVFTILK
jgi:hypothetical protein